MSEEGKNKKPFSTEEIQNYLEGKLSPQEMHAIEKAAMEDPFLADAIEGMEMHRKQSGEKGFEKDLAELQSRLRERIIRKKNSRFIQIMRSWQAAAAVIFLLGAGILAFLLIIRQEHDKENIALSSNSKKADSINVPNKIEDLRSSSSGTEKTDSNRENQQAAPTPASERKSKNRVEEKSTKPETQGHPVPNSLTQVPDSGKNDDALAKNASSAAVKSKKEQIPEAKTSELFVPSANAADHYFLEGKVIDTKNEPIAGATVRMKNKKNATVTDNRGHFKLDIGNEARENAVEIASAGYNSRSTVLDTGANPNIIQLQPKNAALNEIGVNGNAIRNKIDPAEEEDSLSEADLASKKFSGKLTPPPKAYKSNAIPVRGWQDFYDYVNKNKKIQTVDSTIRGTEAISFQVAKNGELSNFSIDKSLSPAHDAEGLRLIKEGPAWKILKGKKQKAFVFISF